MIALGRGLGFPEEDMPDAEGNFMPRVVRLTAKTTIRRKMNLLLKSLLYKRNLSPEFD
jgi:hypothetical protein